MDGSRPTWRVARWALVVALAAGVAVAVVEVWPSPPAPQVQPVCVATSPAGTYSLDLEQAANATTIAAVAKRLGLADHSVTIGLAAALQESGLHDLDHGDRDSLGLFQQRPSQGWGTPAEIMDPSHAALEFFRHLARVQGWELLPVADAAQRVQHSAAPDAYADWEDQARVLASVMTGEVPAGLTCRYPARRSTATQDAARSAGLRAEAVAELGRDPAAGSTTAQGWVAAAWIVGHAHRYGVRSVTLEGRTWAPAHLAWRADASGGSGLRVVPPI